MTTETGSPRSRRALLAAGAAAGVATVASALGRPSPASAAQGVFDSTDADVPAVHAMNTSVNVGLAAVIWGQSSNTNGRGVFGLAAAASGVTAGVHGQADSSSGLGVFGDATHGTGATYGVYGRADSTSGTGVRGIAWAGTGATLGVYGRVISPDGTAVIGQSGSGASLAPSAKTGVYGYAGQDADARGVIGRSESGRGVSGIATNGTAVRGDSTTGTAGYFSVQYPMTGISLRATGRVKLDKSAGIATITSGTNSVLVTPGIDVLSTSAVVATLMGDAGGSTAVKRVAVNATDNTFRIVLTGNSTTDVKVAWHVFG